jgi:hypothetical protein
MCAQGNNRNQKKRAREKNRQREQCVNDDGEDDDDQEEAEKKKRMFYFSLMANQLHDTTHQRNGETAALYPSIVFVCMLSCEVVREPTNRKKLFVGRRERKRTTNEQ